MATNKTDGALRALYDELAASNQRGHLSTFRKVLVAAGRKVPSYAAARRPGPKTA